MRHQARFLATTWRVTLLCAGLTACNSGKPGQAIDVKDALPPLCFSLTRASDGRAVTAADFKGKVALLYFGYTGCSDSCPTTLLDLTEALKRLGGDADKVRILFVSVDPLHDTLPVLKRYGAQFGPQVVGLRGSDDHLAAVARRYRAAYAVTDPDRWYDYQVSHSNSVYVFDASGAARLLIPALDLSHDADGIARELRRIIAETPHPPRQPSSQPLHPAASS